MLKDQFSTSLISLLIFSLSHTHIHSLNWAINIYIVLIDPIYTAATTTIGNVNEKASLAKAIGFLQQQQKCFLASAAYNGPTYEKINELRKQFVTPSAIPYYRKPLLIHKGEMQYLYGHDGTKYLDLFAGIVTISVGHCHPYVNMFL